MQFFEDVKPGDILPNMIKGPITRQHLVEWCAAENDYYHLHYDERVAARMSLPGPPIQGTYKYALLGLLVQRWAGPGGLRRLAVSYGGPDLEGETLTCGGRVTGCTPARAEGIVEIELWIENGRGERATSGEAVVTLPMRGPI